MTQLIELGLKQKTKTLL